MCRWFFVLFLAWAAKVCLGGWLPIDTITNRQGRWDLTCQNNARAVVSDSAGNIYVVWRGETLGVYQVWFSRWDAPTRQWSEDTVISSDASGVGEPAIAADSVGNIYVAWITPGVLKLRKRLATTSEWLPAETLTIQPRDSAVSLALDHCGNRHLVWARYGMGYYGRVCYVRHSGTGWGPDTVISDSSSGLLRPSVVAAPNGDLLVAWHREGTILARAKTDRGWHSVDTLFSGQRCGWPSVGWSPDAVFHVAWMAAPSTGPQRILVRDSTASGWGQVLRIDNDFGDKDGPSVAASDDSAMRVTWHSRVGGSDIIYHWCRTGDTWRLDTIAAGVGIRERISMSAASGLAQVVWSEQPNSQSPPAVRMRRFERVHDIGVLRIEQPRDTVDSAATVEPRAWIRNYGDLPETEVIVRFRMGSILRFDTVNSLVPGESSLVQFAPCLVSGRGLVTVACSTSVSGDISHSNDTLAGSVFVRVKDAVLDSILAPVGRVEAETILPRARVWNRGNIPANFVCCCSIFAGSNPMYGRMLSLTLGPDVRRDSAFPLWIAAPGSYQIRFRTLMVGDMHPENDTASGEFRVVRHDVGVTRIIEPGAGIDSGQSVQPRALVRNYGTEIDTFLVLFRIGDGYNESTRVADLPPGEEREVVFPTCILRTRGWNAVCCSTMLAGDRVESNNAVRSAVFVRVRDCGAVAILRPVEIIGRGLIQPEAVFGNYGNCPESAWCFFAILDTSNSQVYWDSVLAELEPESSAGTVFSQWEARGGRFTARCWTVLPGDMQPENDTLTRGFRVARVDAALEEIVAPRDTVSEGKVLPMVRVANLGEEEASFPVLLTVYAPDSVPVFRDSVWVFGLAETCRTLVQFRQWFAEAGQYRVSARTALAGDELAENDTVTVEVVVESLSLREWREMASLPEGPSGFGVRAGGALVAAEGFIYALKGGGSNEFYRYDIPGDSWQALAPMPAGPQGKRVKGGATLCWDGGNHIFAMKGNNTREFYSYNISADSWEQLPALPENTRPLRYGSGLVFVAGRDTGKVFLVKGSNTLDFLVYWVQPRQWHARRPLPPDARGRRAQRGTCVAGLGGRIFCLRGGTNQLYEYSLQADSWVERARLPLLNQTGGTKRCREGSAIVAGKAFLYAVKGGGCNEFWCYDGTRDSWFQLEPVPLGRFWRRVRTGAALAAIGDTVYLVKGGGSFEFWRYLRQAEAQPFPKPVRLGVICETVVQNEEMPVPTVCHTVGFGPGAKGEVGLFDAIGRVVSDFNRGDPVALRPGVYFILVVRGDSSRILRKVVVVR